MHALSLTMRRRALYVFANCIAVCLIAVTSATADESGYPPPPGPYQSESAALPGAFPEQPDVTTQHAPAQREDNSVLPSSGIPAPLPLRSSRATDAARGSRLFGSADDAQAPAPPSDHTWREQARDGSVVPPQQSEHEEPSWRSTVTADTSVRHSTPSPAPSYYAYPGQSYPQTDPYTGYQPYASPGGWGMPGYGYAGTYSPYGYGYGYASPADAAGRFDSSSADGGGNGDPDAPVWRKSNRPAKPSASDTRQQREPPGSSVLFRPRSEQPTW